MLIRSGIDNFEIGLGVTRREADALKNLSAFKSSDEASYVLLQDLEDPKIFLRFANGKVFANLNAPKLTHGHNIRPAGPEEIATAIRVLALNTHIAAPRLHWDRAEVSRLDINHTCEVTNFEEFRSLILTPRGYWRFNPSEPTTGDYYNSKTRDLHVCVYEKVRHYLLEWERLPDDVILEMASGENALFRIEVRIKQSPYAELKSHGGWNGLSLVAEDLVSGGAFLSALKYLQWKIERFLPIPSLRVPELGDSPSSRAYSAHNARETAFENPERMKERAIADQRAGRITDKVLQAELDRAHLLTRRERALSLHAALAEECEKLTAAFRVSVYIRNH